MASASRAGDLVGGHADLVVLDAGLRAAADAYSPSSIGSAVVAHRERRQPALAERRADGGHRARVEPAGEQRADRNVGDQPAADRSLEKLAE